MRPTRFLSLLLVPAAALSAQDIITTLAGTGYSGFSGDGGAATSALLYNPQSPAVDADGRVYFSDCANHRIRRISPDGIITTIAGNGLREPAGDGGTALSASLGFVYQVAIDNTGRRLCFGDTTAHKIRCVDLATGQIQGFGTGNPVSAGDGGNVADASFYNPQGVAFDETGNLYVADSGANAVRRVDAITQIVATFAGPGPGYSGAPLGDGGPATLASLYQPGGLWYARGALYIADWGNWRVRKVDIASGTITTVAGNGSPYASGDGGLAISAGLVPGSITADAAGVLFIATNNKVRMVDINGVISTIAGNGNTGSGTDDIPATQTTFAGLNGVAWDGVARRLLIADGGNRIRQIFYTEPTTTSLVVTPNPALPGQSTTLRAIVSPASATSTAPITGVVRFYANLFIGSSPISNGEASFTFTPSGTNRFSLRAVYGGDAIYNLSTSETVNLVVQSGTTSTGIISSSNPSIQGQSVTFTAGVKPAEATGWVEFRNGTNVLATTMLSGGTASFTSSSLPAGTASMSARYIGNSQYLGSTSPTLAQVVKFATTTSLTSSPNPSNVGATVALKAIVSPAGATGSVQFLAGNTVLGSASLSNGQAVLAATSLPAGTNMLTAMYSGDGGNAASTSTAVAQVVNRVNSTTTLVVSPAAQSKFGQTVTFTATVSPAIASGTVQFLDGTTVIGTAPLINGSAVFSTTALRPGNYSLKAIYGGDANVNGSQSGVIGYRVKR